MSAAGNQCHGLDDVYTGAIENIRHPKLRSKFDYRGRGGTAALGDVLTSLALGDYVEFSIWTELGTFHAYGLAHALARARSTARLTRRCSLVCLSRTTAGKWRFERTMEELA